MAIVQTFRKALSVLYPQPDSGNEELCHYGRNEGLAFVREGIDKRSRHALAVFDVTLPGGDRKQVTLSPSALRDAIKSYPDTESESRNMRVLHQAAIRVQATGSSLHNRAQGAGPSFRHNLR